MKKSILSAASIACIVAFSASSAVAAKVCRVDKYSAESSYCKCIVDGVPIDVSREFDLRYSPDGCVAQCDAFCYKKNPTPIPKPRVQEWPAEA